MKNLLLIFFSFALLHTAYAQPAIAWQRCYGTTKGDFFTDAVNTNDGGLGATISYGGIDGDVEGLYTLSYPATLMKFDPDFNLQWQRFFGGTNNGSFFAKLAELHNDDFICAGSTSTLDGDFSDNHGSWDLMLVKTDALGNKLWSHCYGSPGYEEFSSMLVTADGGYLLTGQSGNSGGDIPFHYGDGFTNDVIILKTDSMGTLQWIRVLGGSGDEGVLSNTIEIRRGIYITNIVTYSTDHDLAGIAIGGRQRWIIKMDSLGNIIDQNIISGDDDLASNGGHEILYLNNKILMADAANPSTHIFGLSGYGGTYDGAIAVFDTALNFIDMHIYGGSLIDELERVTVDAYGNYYALGISKSSDYDLPDNYTDGLGWNYWLMKTDSNFNVLWSRNFGGSDPCGDLACSSFIGKLVLKDNMLYAFIKSTIPDVFPDHDIACGHPSPDSYDTDAWLVAFDLNTSIKPTDISTANFQLFPNPATNTITIESHIQGHYALQITNLLGQVVYLNNAIHATTIQINTKDFSQGFYIVSILANNKTRHTEKIIIQ